MTNKEIIKKAVQLVIVCDNFDYPIALNANNWVRNNEGYKQRFSLNINLAYNVISLILEDINHNALFIQLVDYTVKKDDILNFNLFLENSGKRLIY